MSYSKFLDSEGSEEEIRDRWITEKRYSALSSFIHENWDLGQWDENNLELEFPELYRLFNPDF